MGFERTTQLRACCECGCGRWTAAPGGAAREPRRIITMHVWRGCAVVLSIWALGSSQLLAASAAAASGTSDAPSDTSSGGLPEIIVTAQKREQALSDVGLTIVTASAEQLQ